MRVAGSDLTVSKLDRSRIAGADIIAGLNGECAGAGCADAGVNDEGTFSVAFHIYDVAIDRASQGVSHWRQAVHNMNCFTKTCAHYQFLLWLWVTL